SEIKQAISDATTTQRVPIDLIDQFLDTEVTRREALRALVDPEIRPKALELGLRAFEGDLGAASPAVKIHLYRYVAAIMAREPSPEPDEAELWLGRARDLG